MHAKRFLIATGAVLALAIAGAAYATIPGSGGIECVAIVGKRPDSPDRTTQDDVLRASNARLITYDVLVQEALDSYHDYLEADDRVARLNEVLEKIGKKFEETVEAEQPPATKEASVPSAKASPRSDGRSAVVPATSVRAREPGFPRRLTETPFHSAFQIAPTGAGGTAADAKSRLCGGFLNGSDGTRTRDLRRDRPAF
jgi:hypothetical protein